jgi:hypothetical protein
VFTVSAGAAVGLAADTPTVVTRGFLGRQGCTRSALRAHCAANRWQVLGNAVVLHNGEPTREERFAAAVINCGPRSALASFSALEQRGLHGWEREEIHVIAPAGVPRPAVTGLSIVLHRTRTALADACPKRRQAAAPALVLAASSFADPRPACGILAAGVQQRLVTAAELQLTLAGAVRVRHRRLMRAAVEDIAMGAQALSEIDFARLCRRHKLPQPVRQAVRVDSSGRRRYLDVEFRRRDGRSVVVEIDGAVHLAAQRWFADQLRQNEIALSGALVLRYPSVVVRTEPWLVIAQLRQALGL